MSKKWIDQKERSNSITLKLICWIALNTSRSFARILLYPITVYFFLTAPRARIASYNYLNRILDKTIRPWDITKHLFWFSATILDRVYFLTNQEEKFQINIHNKELLDYQVNQENGCILLGSHIGSFEVLRSLAISKMFLPVKILMNQDHNQMITKLLESLNPKVAGAVIDLNDPNALFKVKECIEQGDIVGILGDRISKDEKTIKCNFLGGRAEFPISPMKLAAVLNVPVILFIGLYRGKNRYDIYFEKLTDSINSSKRSRAIEIERLTKSYVGRIEYYLKLAPFNWFNFFDFWEDEK